VVLSNGELHAGGATYAYNSVALSGQDVTFHLTGGPVAQSLPDGTEVLPLARSASSVQSVARGGDLSVAAGSTSAFPAHNGWVRIGGDSTLYVYRDNDVDNAVLRGIEEARQGSMPTIAVPADTEIVLQKFARIESTGTYGEGTLQARREVKYHQPLEMRGQKVAWSDPFEDLSHWNPSALGQHEIQSIGGDEALRVTGSAPLGMSGDAGSLKALEWSSTPIDLGLAHRQAGYFLSYDAQVKLGWDPWPPPEAYAAGISFRLQEDLPESDTLGISLVKGGPGDNIPDAILPPLPEADFPKLVLWQRVAGAYTLLAHQRYRGLLYSDAENVDPDWQIDPAGPVGHRSGTNPHTGAQSWAFAPEPPTWTCAVGVPCEGILVTPEIALCNDAVLLFWSWYGSAVSSAEKLVEISTDGGSTWDSTPLFSVPPGEPEEWKRYTVDLSPFAGQTVRIRFHFDFTPTAADFSGWYVDDIVVFNQDPTLLLRLREAAAIAFSGGGTAAIAAGDRVFQATGSATVLEAPLLSGGAWAAGDAAGWILLNNVSGGFSPGALSVSGKGENLAAVEAYRLKDNYIRVYSANACPSGDPAAVGSPTPLDEIRLPHPRQTSGTPVLRWPPDDPEATTALDDHFTLVRWEGAVDPSVLRLGSGKQENAVIRSGTLTTPGTVYAKPELALHTFGSGSTALYFDDFGLQAEFSLPDYPAAIQE
jgi:hypothetical protein